MRRRDFLKGLAALAAGISIPGCRSLPLKRRALIVPPGPEIKPVRIVDGKRCYDLYPEGGNGIIDYCEQGGDARWFNHLPELLGNKFGCGWEFEQKAGGVRLLGTRVNAAISDAPDTLWVGGIYAGSSEYVDLLTGERTPLTESGKRAVMRKYLRKRPHALFGYSWVAEYRDGGKQKLYYPLEMYTYAMDHWPLTPGDLKKIKAKGPVLIEYRD